MQKSVSESHWATRIFFNLHHTESVTLSRIGPRVLKSLIALLSQLLQAVFRCVRGPICTIGRSERACILRQFFQTVFFGQSTGRFIHYVTLSSVDWTNFTALTPRSKNPQYSEHRLDKIKLAQIDTLVRTGEIRLTQRARILRQFFQTVFFGQSTGPNSHYATAGG